MSPYWEFYSTNALSSVSAGKGNTGVASSGDVSLIYINPATLNITNKFQVNACYNLKSESSSDLTQNFYSFSIAGAYRLNQNFQVGFAYQNDYSYDYSPSVVIDWSYINTFETHSFRIPIDITINCSEWV
jgi:long-subunit fatty acid transport protein